MESIDKINSLVRKVLNDELSLTHAIELLSSDEFKPFLSEKVIISLDEVAKSLLHQSPQTAYLLSILAYESAKIIDFPKLQAECGLSLGPILIVLGQFQNAIAFLLEAINIFKDNKDFHSLGLSLNNLGIAYRYQGNYTNAIICHSKALKLFHTMRDKHRETECLGNLGLVHKNLGNYSKAAEYFQQLLPILQKNGNRQAEVQTLGNLGNTYNHLENHSEAIKYYERGLTISQELNDRRGEASFLGNLGTIYHQLEDYQKAHSYYMCGLKTAREIGNIGIEARFLVNLGSISSSLQNYAEAIEHYLDALKMLREIGAFDFEKICLTGLGIVYDQHLMQNDVAYNYYKQAIELAEKLRGMIKQEEHKTSYLGMSENVYDLMIQLCSRIGNKQKVKLIESFEYL